MDLKKILAAAASVLLVGMFYTFAFCIVQDVNQTQIDTEYCYDAAAAEKESSPAEKTEDEQPEIIPGITEESESDNNEIIQVHSETLPLLKAELPQGFNSLPGAVPPQSRMPDSDETSGVSGENEEPDDEVSDSSFRENSELDLDEYTNEELELLLPEEDDILEYRESVAASKAGKSASKANNAEKDEVTASSKKKTAKKKKKTKVTSNSGDTAEVSDDNFPEQADMNKGNGWDGSLWIDNSGDGSYIDTQSFKTPGDTASGEVITAKVHGEVQEFDAYELVCMIVANEMSPSFDQEALKAQAVAAYSYLKYHESRGLTATVLVKENVPDEVRTAVSAVWGQCCYYDGMPAQTVYTASTSGFTASAANVWGGNEVPYLIHQDCPFDPQYDPNYGITVTYSESEIRSKLESYCGITLSDSPSRWLIITAYEDGNYVSEINVDGQTTITGIQMRERVLGYGIKSASFEVSYSDGEFTFTTYGYGHGVGMSQNGANTMGKMGYTYDEILKFYYPGVTVQ